MARTRRFEERGVEGKYRREWYHLLYF